MANGQVNLTISETRKGSGFKSLAVDVDKARSGIAHATADMGKLSGAIARLPGTLGAVGTLLKDLMAGGMWTLGVSAMTKLLDLVRKKKEEIAERAGRITSALEGQIHQVEKLQKGYLQLNAGIAASQKLADSIAAQADASSRAAKAQAELNRQKRLAAGENPDKVNTETDAIMAQISRSKALRDAEKSAGDTQRGRDMAENNMELARSKLEGLMLERKRIEEELYANANELWAGKHTFAAQAGFRIDQSKAKDFLKENNAQKYAEIQNKVKANEEEITKQKIEIAKAEAELAAASLNHKAALEDVKSAIKENAAAELKAENDKAAAKKAAWDAELEAAAKAESEKEKLAQEAADREAEIEGKRTDAMVAEMKRAAEEEAKKREQAEREAHLKKIEDIKKERDERLAAIDKEIAKAKDEAAVWEQNAQQARGGKTFGEWQRGERQAARQKRREDARQANVVRNAEKEIAQLEREQSRFGKGFNAARAKRLEQLRDFVANQDPNNNPALKRAQQLEKDRAEQAKKAADGIAGILKLLQQGVAL